jgi:hypothetical protein
LEVFELGDIAVEDRRTAAIAAVATITTAAAITAVGPPQVMGRIAGLVTVAGAFAAVTGFARFAVGAGVIEGLGDVGGADVGVGARGAVTTRSARGAVAPIPAKDFGGDRDRREHSGA